MFVVISFGVALKLYVIISDKFHIAFFEIGKMTAPDAGSFAVGEQQLAAVYRGNAVHIDNIGFMDTVKAMLRQHLLHL